MKKAILLSAWLLSCLITFANGPVKRTCGSMENLNRLKKEDPALDARMKQIEDFTNSYINNNRYRMTSSGITIPVVFHVVYNSPSQNLTTAQCQAQISQLNLDFARMNSDSGNTPSAFQGIAANTNIQFCLAQRDPNGNATTGVERRSTGTASFTSNDDVKSLANGGMDPWPAASYLNIWTCNLSGGLLGYAQLPGGPAASDGVVLQYNTVGSMLQPGSMANYNLGRTATHEVGHWLNLLHVWGDDSDCSGTDNVGDTPNQGVENYNCPAFPVTDGCSPVSPGVMFMNYMDYVDDACMNMFSNGQSTRMNALFSGGGPRAALLNSTGCQAPAVGCGTASQLTSSSITSNGAVISWAAVSGAVSYNIHFKVSTASSWNITTSNTNSKTLIGLVSGKTYLWQVQSVCSLGGSAYTPTTSFNTSPAQPCGVPASLNSSSITSGSASLSWTAVSGASGYNVQYKITGSLTWSNVASGSNTKSITGLVPGTSYTFQVMAVCPSGSGIYSSSASFSTLASSCSDTNEPNNTFQTPALISTNIDITGQINIKTDLDWYTFTTTAPNTKLLIVLSNLPNDFNFRLYNSSLGLIATSNSLGTANDSIKRNFTAAGTYYICVFGQNNAFNPYQCYNLRVNVSNINFRHADGGEDEEIKSVINHDLKVFPNPVRDNLNGIYTSSSNQSVTIRVFDMVGKTVNSIPLEAAEGENKFNFDFTGLNKGIYFVEVIEAGNRITKKVILE